MGWTGLGGFLGVVFGLLCFDFEDTAVPSALNAAFAAVKALGLARPRDRRSK